MVFGGNFPAIFCPISELSLCRHISLQLMAAMNDLSLIIILDDHFTSPTSRSTTFDTRSTPTARDSLIIDLDLPDDAILLPQDNFQYIGKVKESNNLLLFDCFLPRGTLKRHTR
jgi:hypothetical protein